MGKIPILTKEQETVLGEIIKIKYFKDNFYFTGGTALSLIYLQHRYSEDIDFFSEKSFDNQTIFTLMQDLSKKLNFEIQSDFKEVVYIFNLTFKNRSKLKVDFGYYPYQRIEKGQLMKNFKVDSLTDVAVNKLLTITQRTDVKDFVDLYFLLKKFTVWTLMDEVKIKFRVKLEPLLVGGDFLKIEDFDFLPKMLVPLTLKELQEFYREQAKKLGMKVVKK